MSALAFEAAVAAHEAVLDRTLRAAIHAVMYSRADMDRDLHAAMDAGREAYRDALTVEAVAA